LAIVSCVVNGLGGDHHQRGGGIEARDRIIELCPVDVGHETHLGAVGIPAQGLQREPRAERGAADPESEHAADARAGMALPQPLAYRLGHHAHALAVALHFGQHVLAVHVGVFVAAQRGVQRGAVLGQVHALAGEQPLDRLGQPAIAREGHQQAERLGRGALLGEVRRDAGAVEGEGVAARGIVLPQLADAAPRERVAVGDERLPGRGRGEGRHRAAVVSRCPNSTPAPTPRFPAPCPPPR
jgi:hypothetical protein